MLRDAYSDIIGNQFKHPWLLTMGVLGILAIVVGLGMNTVIDNLVPGFFGVYGILLLSVMVFGYAVVITIRLLTTRNDRFT